MATSEDAVELAKAVEKMRRAQRKYFTLARSLDRNDPEARKRLADQVAESKKQEDEVDKRVAEILKPSLFD